MFFKNRNFKFMFVYVFLFVTTFLVGGFFVTNTVKADNPAVIISEFSPVSSTEWVELSNTTSSPIDLGTNGYKLVDASNHVKTLSGTIPAYGLLVFEYSNWLNNTGGDSLTLLVGEVNTPVMSASYGNVDLGSPTLHIAGIPLASESIIVNNDNLSIATTPTKGWFNDAGQNGKAPLLSTIDTTITTSGITTNIGELTNPSATPSTEEAEALYFEKAGYGKIVFEKVLNMSDQNTVGVLQSLDTAMEMSTGHIKFDSTTATDMNATGAKIYMYGLSEFNSEPSLIVKNDTGTIIPPSDGDNYPTIVKSWDNNTKTLSFTTNHFTQFDIETQATPTFSPVAGAAAWGTTVTISSSGADAIYYTTNGDTPTTSSTNQASTPLVINGEVTVKALAVKTGLLDSIISSATYTEATSDNLTDVVLSETPGNYTFSGGTYTYNNVTVANNVESITVTPTGAGVITMSIDSGSSATLTSGVASSAIPLIAGTEKTITIVAIETSKSAKTYTIKVMRALNSSQIAAASTVLVNTTQKEVMVNSTAPTTITIPENVIDSKINVNSLVSIVGTEKTATLPAITLNVATSLSTTNVEVKIPTGTVVTAPTGWDGTINAPTIKENSMVTATPDSGMTSTVSSVIEVGYGDVKLTFDKAVRILIPGQAGKFAGYSRGGVFTEITSVCAADNQTTGDALPAEGDCKIDVGSDMIIWTKHFTTFATYTQSASRTSGGGSYYIRPVVALAPVVTPTTAVGKVLGVEKFNFTKFLKFKALSYKVSLQGAEVMELQKLLNNFGSTLIIDGKFGPKTKGAVVKFQKANKLVGDGIVGTKTRAELNK